MATIATGSTVTCATTSFAAEITNIAWSGITRPALKSSSMTTTNDDTFVAGALVDNGELSIDILFDGTETPPIITNAAAETVTVKWGSVTNTFAASMICTGFEIAAALEELMTGTVTFKATGAITPA